MIGSKKKDRNPIRDDICKVLEKEFDFIGFQKSAGKSQRKGYGGTQTAAISLLVGAAPTYRWQEREQK